MGWLLMGWLLMGWLLMGRLLISRRRPGDALPSLPGLVVSHRALRPGCQQALPALAMFACTSIGLHHVPLTCPFRARGTTGCDLDPSPPQVQLSCHPVGSAVAATTGARQLSSCAKLPTVRSGYWFGYGYRPGPGTVARQTLR
jgi:hypothetical protein